jgi:hypothetical protein
MAAADNAPVVIVIFPIAVVPPIAPVKVTSPVPAATVNVFPAVPALVVPLNVTLELVVVNVMLLEMVALPVYVCVDEVVTLAPRLEVVDTDSVVNPVAAPSKSKAPVMIKALFPPARVDPKLTIDPSNVLFPPYNIEAPV